MIKLLPVLIKIICTTLYTASQWSVPLPPSLPPSPPPLHRTLITLEFNGKMGWRLQKYTTIREEVSEFTQNLLRCCCCLLYLKIVIHLSHYCIRCMNNRLICYFKRIDLNANNIPGLWAKKITAQKNWIRFQLYFAFYSLLPSHGLVFNVAVLHMTADMFSFSLHPFRPARHAWHSFR